MQPKISRLHLPMRNPADVKPHLASPIHWKEGRSAHALCSIWEKANAIPPKVKSVLATHPATVQLELVDAFLERRVELGDGSRPSQTDLMAICSDDHGLLAMAIEATVNEPFDKIVDRWQDSSGKAKRLEMLCQSLGIDVGTAGPLRYQLLHRTVSAIIEAKHYRSSRAMMVVQSFSQKNSGFDDFARFAAAIGFGVAQPDTVLGPKTVDGTQLMLAWVADRLPETTIAEGSALQ